MILPAQMIREINPPLITPFEERTSAYGMTYGLGPAGYDVRIEQDIFLKPGYFILASTMEHFDIPPSMMAFVYDKSTWARRGLSLFNTVIEPGWKGFLTLELTNLGPEALSIRKGMPIAQIVFQVLIADTEIPYEGKYQDQPDRPVGAILK